ncbi:hypothetical protein CBS101457_002123 [Exobasidium rhododendri]|nr:hypothetical protein CBS101457_002123 [Exobasidium rhododendri]
MTTRLSKFCRSIHTGPNYTALAPKSPEANASTFLPSTDSIPIRGRNVHFLETSDRKGFPTHSSEKRYPCGHKRKVPITATPTWSDTACAVGQWASSTASTVANTFSSTTKEPTAQPASSNASRSTPKTQSPSNIRRDPGNAKVYGRGIDRHYLRESTGHPEVIQGGGLKGYIGSLANRFTAPKESPTKAQWIE